MGNLLTNWFDQTSSYEKLKMDVLYHNISCEPNIQELDIFSIKKEQQETKEIEGKYSGKTQMIHSLGWNGV